MCFCAMNMTFKPLLFIVFSLLSLSPPRANSGVLYPVVVNDRWGFMDKSGNLAANPGFERAGAFAGGMAEVRLGKWGYIDESGKFVINPQFDEALSFGDGLARVKLGRKTGYVDLGGKYVWPPSN